MATTLYKNNEKGELVTVRVETKKVQGLLSAGYVCNPADLIEEVEEEKDDKFAVDPIRTEAKEAGIRNWHNKRLETLKRELGYDED